MQSLRAGFLACVAVMALMSAALMAQETTPRTEIFGGYAWQDPGAKFSGVNIGGMSKGFNVQSTFNFSKYIGLSVDSGASFKDKRANISYIFAGPTVNLRQENVSPFFHVMVGLHRVNPAPGFPLNPQSNNGVGMLMGGGLDLRVNDRVSVRAIEADYIWGHHNYGGVGGTTQWDGARLGGGLVFKLGSLGPPPAPPAASCSAQPTEVMAGEPVQVTATPANFGPKVTPTYSWTSSGGKVGGSSATTSVDTTGLAPGSYTVTANISGGKRGSASCNASFSVKAPPEVAKRGPTISCSANPSTVQSGAPSTITSKAASPDNRPVKVTYRTSGGSIRGNGNRVVLDTSGAPAGSISITCTATDDRGMSASDNTSVNVEVPQAAPTASKLNEIQFPNKKKPARVDNEAKAILDDVALRLQRDADAKAVVIGNATAEETKGKRNPKLAAQRAVNTKDYLVSEKGIDPSRIEVRTGSDDAQKAEIWIVPAGATFSGTGSAVPEGSVKAQPRNPAPAKHAAKKAAAPAQ